MLVQSREKQMAGRKKTQRLGNLVFKAPSTIHGTGLFAKVDINEGQQIGSYEGPTAKRDGT